MTDRPVLLVASAGGHLTQMIELEPRLTLEGERRWVTFEGPQGRSLLDPERVDYVPRIPPRGLFQSLRAVPYAVRILRRHRPAAVVSTGAAIAVVFLPLARLLGIPAYYVESATRSQSPSLSGRIVRWVPGVKLYTQHPRAAGRHWHFAGTVFEGYQPEPVEPRPIEKVVVSFGTMKGFGFRRAVERLVDVIPPDAEVLWQTGPTKVDDLGIEGRSTLATGELEAAIEAADVVVAHAGTGTALTCIRLGKQPVLIPRRAGKKEHVDDHQMQTSEYLAGLGLAVVAEADDLELEHLHKAASVRIVRVGDPPPFELD